MPKENVVIFVKITKNSGDHFEASGVHTKNNYIINMNNKTSNFQVSQNYFLTINSGINTTYIGEDNLLETQLDTSKWLDGVTLDFNAYIIVVKGLKDPIQSRGTDFMFTIDAYDGSKSMPIRVFYKESDFKPMVMDGIYVINKFKKMFTKTGERYFVKHINDIERIGIDFSMKSRYIAHKYFIETHNKVIDYNIMNKEEKEIKDSKKELKEFVTKTKELSPKLCSFTGLVLFKEKSTTEKLNGFSYVISKNNNRVILTSKNEYKVGEAYSFTNVLYLNQDDYDREVYGMVKRSIVSKLQKKKETNGNRDTKDLKDTLTNLITSQFESSNKEEAKHNEMKEKIIEDVTAIKKNTQTKKVKKEEVSEDNSTLSLSSISEDLKDDLKRFDFSKEIPKDKEILKEKVANTISIKISPRRKSKLGRIVIDSNSTSDLCKESSESEPIVKKPKIILRSQITKGSLESESITEEKSYEEFSHNCNNNSYNDSFKSYPLKNTPTQFQHNSQTYKSFRLTGVDYSHECNKIYIYLHATDGITYEISHKLLKLLENINVVRNSLVDTEAELLYKVEEDKIFGIMMDEEML